MAELRRSGTRKLGPRRAEVGDIQTPMPTIVGKQGLSRNPPFPIQETRSPQTT
jgi:hypothetical protein